MEERMLGLENLVVETFVVDDTTQVYGAAAWVTCEPVSACWC